MCVRKCLYRFEQNVSRNLIYENWCDKDKKLPWKRIWIPSIVEYLAHRLRFFSLPLSFGIFVWLVVIIVAVDIVIVDTVAVTWTQQNILLFCGQIKTLTYGRKKTNERTKNHHQICAMANSGSRTPIFPWQTMMTMMIDLNLSTHWLWRWCLLFHLLNKYWYKAISVYTVIVWILCL